jgi:GNAT superfamily N-acetyltransferase
MTDNQDRGLILSRLGRDVLRHIVTLKMLRLHGEAMELRFNEDGGGWALLSLLPVRVSDFDRQAYAGEEYVVLVDGTSGSAKEALLEALPRARLVIKTYDEAVGRFASDRLRATRVRSFVSFTAAGAAPPLAVPAGVSESGILVPEIARMLSTNGYLAAELAGHFAAGARWFAVQEAGRNVSAGFVFQNYDDVWEVGGLFTEPGWRRRGLARRIVTAALGHLAGRRLVPRYQVRSDNVESLRLAESAGLREFLRVDHYLAHPG